MTFLYHDRGETLLIGIAAIGRREHDKEWEMLYMSNARVSRRARRWAYANRPYESIDNPVKRYLGNRLPVSKSSRVSRFRRALGSGRLRPAF